MATASVGIDGTCMLFCEEGWRQAMVATLFLRRHGRTPAHGRPGRPPEYGRETFCAKVDVEIQRFKQRYKRVESIGLADGAHDNWSWLEQRADRAILDFWHAAGYVEKAASVSIVKREDRLVRFLRSGTGRLFRWCARQLTGFDVWDLTGWRNFLSHAPALRCSEVLSAAEALKRRCRDDRVFMQVDSQLFWREHRTCPERKECKQVCN